MTVCASDVAISGSAACVLCKTGLKERGYNGIRLCYSVESQALFSCCACAHRVDLRTVDIVSGGVSDLL